MSLPSLSRLAHQFRLKLAQGDPFAQMDRSAEDKELAYAAIQTLQNLDNANKMAGGQIDSYMSPEKAYYYFPNIQLAKNVLQLKKLSEDAAFAIEDLREMNKTYRQKYDSLSPDERDKYKEYFANANKLRPVLEGGLVYNDPNFAAKASEIQNVIHQLEGDKQDQGIQEFYQKEKTEKAEQAKSIAGKSIFSEKDVAAIIGSEMPKIKAAIVKSKIPGKPTITFIFNPNNVQIAVTGLGDQSIKLANILRRDVLLDIQMDYFHYLISNKKYMVNPVNYSISI